MVMSGSVPALELSHISKRYGSFAALSDASLVVRPGTVHAVLGENGAGKTTLMHVAYGMIRPDTGVVRAAGRELRLTSPLAAIAANIGMVHQHFTLVSAMTVQENLALGGSGRLRERDMTARVREITDRTGLALDPFARVDSLSVSAQQRVELAKALARNATMLILDEPTAVLAPSEIDDLLRWLRSYVAAGHSAVLITHKLHEALAVADDVTVLRRGTIVHVGSASTTSARHLTDAMIGATDLDDREMTTPMAVGATEVFIADHVSVSDRGGRVRVREASFTVRRGDLVAIAAVEGAGQHELLRVLAGRRDISSGSLTRPAVVGFVPEDRHRDAVLLDRSLSENVALRGAGARHGVLDWKAVDVHTAALLRAFDVRATSAQAPLRTLSGGNQQKFVLARELASSLDEPASEALVVENPSRGLDVRATIEVHQRLRAVSAQGTAVVVYSSDLDEALALASRVFVLFDGRLCETPLDRVTVGRTMLGLQ